MASLPDKKSSASYFITYTGDDFENYVKAKFLELFPEMLGSGDLQAALSHISFRTFLLRHKRNGTPDKRFKKGMSNSESTGSFPASIGPLSPTKIVEMCAEQGGPHKYGMETKYTKTLVHDYHDAVELNKIDIDSDNNATPEEFAQKIDDMSKSVMEEYKALEPATSAAESNEDFNEKIKVCFDILYKRLVIHADNMKTTNDFMTENGWKVWRNHARVAASFAVLYLSLQLYRYKKFGTFWKQG